MYRDPFPEEEVREVRRMKARIERERIPPGEDPQFHLKLGRGSLSDVEFTVQLLQLAARRRVIPRCARPATIAAIHRLREAGLLDGRRRRRARGGVPLLRAGAERALPADGQARRRAPDRRADRERLARLLGYVDRPQASLRDDYRRVTRRSRRVVERVFYGRD